MNLQQFYTDTLNGGATYNIITGEYNPKKDYFVSLFGREKRIKEEDFTQTTIKDFINDNVTLLNDVNYLGSWADNGYIYLDVSVRVDSLEDALKLGYQNRQLAIYDANKGKVIDLPTPQKTGTNFQQKEYLRITIENILRNETTI